MDSQSLRAWSLALILGMTLPACQMLKKEPPVKAPNKPSTSETPPQPTMTPEGTSGSSTTPKASKQDYPLLKRASWQEIAAIQQDDMQASWSAWLQSCQGLKNKIEWQVVCQQATKINKNDVVTIQTYWQQNFDVYSTAKQNGEQTGLITGYYQPILRGSRKPVGNYTIPLYKAPKDLITVNLSNLYPELKFKRIRGRLTGNSLVPYYTRAEIEHISKPLMGAELVWVDDPIEAFFLEVQGSGVIKLDNGETMMVGYADQNGHPYQSIGKLLIDRGELTLAQASMQGIKDWASKNPYKLRDLLNANPSYVFFKELPSNLTSPLGALGVPLTAERSVAIDPKYIPLGAPVFLSTTLPNSTTPLQRLMMAQDTGGAIRDGVRADFYWGTGEYAGKMAGGMKQSGKLWVLLPKGFSVN